MGHTFLLVAISLVVCVLAPAECAIWYVDGSVSVSGDGRSWDTAVKSIGEGIDLAYPGDTVLVAAAGSPYSEWALDFRRKAIEVRSVEGPDRTIVDCGGEDHAFRFHSGETDSSVLDGFTIRNARVGLECYGVDSPTSPTILNCKISGNGDGISCAQNSKATFINCTVSRSTYGGIACQEGGQPTFTNCLVTENGTYGMQCTQANNTTVVRCSFLKNNGPGLRCDSSAPAISESSFCENEHGILCENDGVPLVTGCFLSGNRVSGIYCSKSSPTVVSCLIADNAAELGGGVYCDRADPEISNCTIRSYSTEQGAEIFCAYSNPTITNTILWGDSTRPINWDPASYPEVTYCAVRTGWLGEGNIEDDPQFVDADGLDNDTTTYEDNNYRLSAGSPCIDKGKNEDWMWGSVDLDGNLRVLLGESSWRADMGAYEFIVTPFRYTAFLRATADDFQVVWTSQPGDAFTVWSRLDLSEGPWNQETTVPSQGVTTSWTDTLLSASVKFYRIELK